MPLDGEAWRSVADRLGAPAEVVPSLYELGDSMAEWAVAVLDLVGPGRHTVVGNSVGASCAAEMAHLAPERVGRLVLVGGKLGHRPEPALRDEAVRVLAEDGLEPAWARYWAPLFGPAAGPVRIEATRRRVLASSVDDVMRGVRVFHERDDRSDLCDHWTGRLDVVVGALDRSPSPWVAASALGRAVDGGLQVLDDVAHYVPIEAPDRLAEIIGGCPPDLQGSP